VSCKSSREGRREQAAQDETHKRLRVMPALMSPDRKAPMNNSNPRLDEIKAAIHSARTLEWNASQMNDARGVFAAGRILDDLYAERDEIVAQMMSDPNYVGSPIHY